jgi:hypothetical protein
MVETFLAYIQADDQRRLQLLDLAGATGYLEEITDELDEPTSDPTDNTEPAPEPTAADTPDDIGGEKPATQDKPVPAASRIPLRSFEDLLIGGVPMLINGSEPSGDPSGHGGGSSGGGGAGNGMRAAAGTDLSALDQLGMAIAVTGEHQRVQTNDRIVEVLPHGDSPLHATTCVVDVSTPATILAAEKQNESVKAAFNQLEAAGISRLHPGFDILTIVEGEIDRMIELKSSTVDAQVQAMSWNEWKTARSSDLRERFWLYLAGNLRADLPHAKPFLRAIRDPFGSLLGKAQDDVIVRRAVQLRVREFGQAENFPIDVKEQTDPTPVKVEDLHDEGQ